MHCFLVMVLRGYPIPTSAKFFSNSNTYRETTISCSKIGFYRQARGIKTLATKIKIVPKSFASGRFEAFQEFKWRATPMSEPPKLHVKIWSVSVSAEGALSIVVALVIVLSVIASYRF
jgi:hypothetical protein